jgi:hypothetical protein
MLRRIVVIRAQGRFTYEMVKKIVSTAIMMNESGCQNYDGLDMIDGVLRTEGKTGRLVAFSGQRFDGIFSEQRQITFLLVD